MQCKCGNEMIGRVQTIKKVKIHYKHCQSCTRNYVSEKERLRLEKLEADIVRESENAS